MIRDAEIFADGTCSGKLTWTCPVCDIPTVTQADDYGDRDECGALD